LTRRKPRLKPWTGRTPGETENIAKQNVYNLLPKDGKPIKWGELKKRAKEQYPHLSSATLSKHLKRFVSTGTVIREKSKTPSKYGLPEVYYRLKTNFEQSMMQKIATEMEKEWSTEEEKALDEIRIVFSLLIRHLGLVITEACKRETAGAAVEYVDLMIDVEMQKHIHEITKFCHKLRNTSHDGIPVLYYEIDGYLTEAEETAKKWLTNHCPEWARPLSRYVPPELFANILLLNEKEEALKEIRKFISQT
jgi:DNA-binding HxlR family transcriptional regulator